VLHQDLLFVKKILYPWAPRVTQWIMNAAHSNNSQTVSCSLHVEVLTKNSVSITKINTLQKLVLMIKQMCT
jgi:hypothetical protein